MRIEIVFPPDGTEYSLQTNMQEYYWNEAIRKPITDPNQLIHSPIEEGDRTRSIPNPVRIICEIKDAKAPAEKIKITVSENKDLSNPVKVIEVCADTKEIPLYNLKINRTYYYSVEAVDPVSGETVRTETRSIKTANKLPRWINIPGCINVRDIGGYTLPNGKKIKQGMIYRGATPEAITEEGKQAAKELGIRTEVELRYQFPDNLPSYLGEDVNYVLCGTAGYYIKNEDYIPGYRTFFKLLADKKNYPIYMHCHAGADRTGTAAYLIHALLGISRHIRAADYDQTTLSERSACRNRNCEPYRDWLFKDLRSFDEEDSAISDQECMIRYLHSIGITDDEIQRIIDILTEE